jgi:type VI secretion system protein ImpG
VDRQLLRYYQRELQHLREVAAEFAEEFPKIAGRLALDRSGKEECRDPYVERLLEGFAFLAARVHLKLDSEFPRFAQSLLETVYPHYLAPTPSMAIVHFEPDLNEAGLAQGAPIPRGTAVRSILGKGDRTACEYRTAHEVVLWPLELVSAKYYTREIASLALPPACQAKAAIQIRLQTTAGLKFSQIGLDRLVLYLRGVGDIAMATCEQLFAHRTAVVLQPTTRPLPWQHVAEASHVQQVGFDDDEALLPYGPRSFQGYRLLHECFAFPQRYMFVGIGGLADAVKRCQSSQLDIIIPLREANLSLENMIDASSFALFCAPAINLFPKRADRIHVSDRFSEFHVVPDRTRPLDFEVYRVEGVTGHGSRADQEVEFTPFYSATDFDAKSGAQGAYYTVNRVNRLPSGREKQAGRRSSYGGSEVRLSLVDTESAPYRADLKELSVRTLCTNRDLPLQMPTGQGRSDFTMDISAPVTGIRCITGPTPPRPSHAEGEFSWRLISHFALNYLSLVQSEDGAGATAMRDLLRLYSDSGEAQTRQQIEGLVSVSSRPIVRRVITPGPVTFARGLEITVTFDESAFEGTGVFLLGAVLERFFAKYVSINSFTETVVKTVARGVIAQWPARMGTKATL